MKGLKEGGILLERSCVLHCEDLRHEGVKRGGYSVREKLCTSL